MHIKTIAVTLGDPAGIGPEIALKAVQALEKRLAAREFRLLIVGDVATLQMTGERLGLRVPAVTDLKTLQDAPSAAILPTSPLREPIKIGAVSAESGRQAFEAVEIAVRQAQAGAVSALVTAPLNKEALHLA